MRQQAQQISDGDRVMHAAALLEISEYEIFQRAYNDWYGQEADLRTLEHEFVQYLYFGTAPPWVRHYTRMLLDQHGEPVAVPARGLGVSGALLRLMDSRVGRFLVS